MEQSSAGRRGSVGGNFQEPGFARKNSNRKSMASKNFRNTLANNSKNQTPGQNAQENVFMNKPVVEEQYVYRRSSTKSGYRRQSSLSANPKIQVRPKDLIAEQSEESSQSVKTSKFAEEDKNPEKQVEEEKKKLNKGQKGKGRMDYLQVDPRSESEIRKRQNRKQKRLSQPAHRNSSIN